MKISIGNLEVRCVQSEVDNQSDVEALFYFVDAAAEPIGHQRVANASDLREGQAVLLEAQPGRFFIHVQPPASTSDEMIKEVLRCCFANAFALCETHGIVSIALPLTSGLEVHCPVSVAAAAATEAIVEQAKADGPLKRVLFAVASAAEFNTLPRHLIRGAASLEAA